MPESTRSQLVRVAVFTILGILVFALLIFTFKPAVRAIRGGYRVYLHLDRAGEIRRGTPVRHLGIDAGEVLRVDYAPPQQGGVILTLLVRPDAPLRDDPGARPYVDTALVQGTAYVEFPRANASAPLLKPGATIEGEYRKTAPDLIAAFGNLSSKAEETLVEIKGAAAEIRDEIDSVGAAFRGISARAERLLEYHPIDQPNQTVEPNISTVLQRLDRFLANANALVGDTQMHRDVKDAIASVRTTSERLATAADDVQEMAKRARAIADRGETVAAKLERTIDEAGTALRQQNDNVTRVAQATLEAAERLGATLQAGERLFNEATQGRGSLGRFINDPVFHEELLKGIRQINEAARELNFLVTELQEHPGDYIRYGRGRTSEEERKERRKTALKPVP